MKVLPGRSVAGTDFNKTKSSDSSDIENISVHSASRDETEEHLEDDVEVFPTSPKLVYQAPLVSMKTLPLSVLLPRMVKLLKACFQLQWSL